MSYLFQQCQREFGTIPVSSHVWKQNHHSSLHNAPSLLPTSHGFYSTMAVQSQGFMTILKSKLPRKMKYKKRVGNLKFLILFSFLLSKIPLTYIFIISKADQPHLRDYPHTPPDYRNTDKNLGLVMATLSSNFEANSLLLLLAS